MVSVAFTGNQIQAWNKLPLKEAMNRARVLAGLEDADPDVAIKDYLKVRTSHEKEVLLNAANRAAGNLDGATVSLSPPLLDLLTPLLQAGGRVTVTLREGKPILKAQAPVAPVGSNGSEEATHRTSYDNYHKGEKIDGPLTKFLRETYPNSRAVTILDRFKGKKTKVGPWEAIQRDKAIRDNFTRNPKA